MSNDTEPGLIQRWLRCPDCDSADVEVWGDDFADQKIRCKECGEWDDL